MNAEIVNRPEAQVLGVIARIDPTKASFGDLWGGRFGPRESEIAALAAETGFYGVYYGTDRPGIVDFVAGMVVEDLAEVPEGLTLRALPGGTYAVFCCALATIGATWGAIYGRWLPTSGYVEDASRPCFEFFPPGAPGPDQRVVICLPIAEA